MSLALSDITFAYPGTDATILRDISLDVPPGTSLAVMGPSGRGKSTLLGIAGLMLAPQRGQVVIGGVPVGVRDAPHLLGSSVAWILQSVNLLPRRTVIDNVALPLLATGVPRRAAMVRARELLKQVDLDPDDDREARTLSGGQAQRVGVARALSTEPVLILADEPTANLDASTAATVARALYAATADTTLVITTHDEAVGSMADVIFRIGEDHG